MESIHDPMENPKRTESHSKISENSFIIRSVFNQRGDLISKHSYNSKGSLASSELLKYDEKNNNIEHTVYHFKDLWRKRINTFNTASKLIESNLFDGFGKHIEKQVIEDNNDGPTTIFVYALTKGNFVKTSEHLYNALDQNIENRYFINNTLTYQEMNQFDEHAHRIETIQYYPLKNEERTTHFKYDHHNNITETVVLNGSLMMESKTVSTYDNQHQVLELFTYGVMGNLKEHVKHQYKYDDENNWTQDITFVNKKQVSVRIRKIEYY